MRRSRVAALLAALLVTAVLVPATPSSAYWSAASLPGGGGAASATSVDPGARPVASASGTAVTVTWQASTLATGQPVSGYVVRRYDSVTMNEQVVGAGCAAVVSTTSCVEAATPDGSWFYTVTPRFATSWRGAASDPSVAVVVNADVVAPQNHVSVVPVTGGAALSGNTVYYRGAAAGSLSLSNALTDAGSGPASSRTHALTGTTTGWTHTPSTVVTPAGGPYESNTFSWVVATSSAPSEIVTGTDVAGNSADTQLTFSDDSVPPTDGTITYPDGNQTTLSVNVSFTAGNDSGSGVASGRLQRSSSTLTGSSCDPFDAFVDLGTVDPVSPVVDSDITVGHCYRYRYVVLDRVGNQRTTASANVVKVVEPGPPLGASKPFSVLGTTGVTNTGPTTLSGNLGSSPSSAIVGFPPGIVAGTTHAGDAVAAQARADFVLAYNDADARAPDTEFSGDQNGKTFTSGVHHSTAAFALTGTMTLDAGGDPNAIFIFQVDAALDTAAASHVVLLGGAQASHVFWQSLGAVTIGANATFAGTILGNAAVNLGDGSTLIGRALSGGLVTMASNTVRFTDAHAPVITINGGATAVTKSATPTISGTTDAATGTVVRVAVAGQALTAPTQAGGTWSVTTAPLLSGVRQVVASVGDASGNAASAAQLLTVELNPAPVDLGSATTYSIVSGGAVANAGITQVSGDVAARLTASGFLPGSIGGTTHVGDTAAATASSDVATAYAELRARTPDAEISGDQIGKTFHAGVYHSAAAFANTGTMTLDGEGVSGAIFIFQIGAAMSPAAGSRVVLVNGAQAKNVYWQVAGAAAVGATSVLVGSLLASGAITLGAGTEVTGRLLTADNVSLAANKVLGVSGAGAARSQSDTQRPGAPATQRAVRRDLRRRRIGRTPRRAPARSFARAGRHCPTATRRHRRGRTWS